MNPREKEASSVEGSDSLYNESPHSPQDVGLKRSKDHTVLSPQPSDDPNDPLVSVRQLALPEAVSDANIRTGVNRGRLVSS